MNDEIEEMCKAAVDAINVSYEDYDQDSDLYEGFMEGFNAAWKQLTAERDRLKAESERLRNALGDLCNEALETRIDIPASYECLWAAVAKAKTALKGEGEE